ncbi:MAG: NAD-dependent epimerase/dehydratase family protein [Candidatus Kerfeldbacteria bacterium]
MQTRDVIFEKRNVLVIGGAGFIGSHLCDELIKTSKVICLDNYASGSVANISHILQNPNFIFLRHDITKPIDLASFKELELFQIKFQGIQEVYYLACPTVQKGFEEFMVDTAKANSVGVVNALGIARKYNAKFLFTSTRSVYGDPLEGQDSFQEDYWGFVDALSDRACYNEGKRFAETLVMTYNRTYNMNTKIARIFNTYGPRMLLQSGRMIPDFVEAAIENQDLEIYGDGSAEDSYCYVDDMIQGIVELMNSDVNDPVNLGDPQPFKIIDIAKKITELVGSKSNTVFAEELTGLVRFAPPDIERAKKYLGWFPVTELETGLQRTVEDMQGSRVLSYQSIKQAGQAEDTQQSEI